MEQLYRWIRCKEKTPNPDACFRELWQNPYDENHKSWMYFNGKIDEFDQIYDEDFIIEPINQDTVEWLSPIEESEQEELWQELFSDIGNAHKLAKLKSKFTLIKK